jgi:hypothetical protein
VNASIDQILAADIAVRRKLASNRWAWSENALSGGGMRCPQRVGKKNAASPPDTCAFGD